MPQDTTDSRLIPRLSQKPFRVFRKHKQQQLPLHVWFRYVSCRQIDGDEVTLRMLDGAEYSLRTDRQNR
jgi:hypothetical protein